MFIKKLLYGLILLAMISNTMSANPKQKGDKSNDTKSKLVSETFSGLKFRSLGPGATSGRVADIAVNPNNFSEWYIAVASGNVWKTTNAGVTFTPIFDSQGSYSIGCVAIDPNNTNVVWVGTGENNSQRSVSYGDGVYKSIDGGLTWKNMGLKNSEHIAKIVIHPRNSNIVYVASQGPLWGSGGDRGLYKTTDGGETWEISKSISENTGVTDVVMDPRDPDVLYCASYQRRRHVWTLINGGPEAAIFKSTDAGKTWGKLTNGLPTGDVGRIGLAISPQNPDIIYATIEGLDNKGGFYCSTNRGASWERRNPWFSGSAQYYTEIFADPLNQDLLYVMDTYTRVSRDGGRTFNRLSNKYRHVDDHAMWINPTNNNHFLIGGDGGLYETFDQGKTFRFSPNLPTTQIYRISVDNAKPFYNVYYGTQDNNTWGGPSRTTNSDGIINDHWYMVVGGDGYQARVDPTNPDIVYAQWQYGNLVRYDRKSGEVFYIQPQPDKGEMIRWNWDTPLIISHHSPTRIYIAANRVYRSDNRGDNWTLISPDLTRQIDRNLLPVMGKIWGPDAVAKNASTSLYGNIVGLSESPINENLIVIGTDDGLIQITEDGGANWRKVSNFTGVPETTYVSCVFTSHHDENVIYATFNNHKMADFKPYVIKSTDKGRTWSLIINGLPENHPVWTIYEDYKNPDLLFLGTEFSFFISIDGGKNWIEHKSGLPTIAVRDIDIQKRENDIVLGTFGRGVYILDDYSPLRMVSAENMEKEAFVFPVRDALMFNLDESFARDAYGSTYYRADNPPYGAVFTYYVKDLIKTKKQLRQDEEAKLIKEGKSISYPSMEQLQQEDEEKAPYLMFKIMDMQDNTVRILTAPYSTGIKRIVWDLKYPSPEPVTESTDINKHSGMHVMPGQYKVAIYKNVDGLISQLTDPVTFTCKLLDNVTLPAKERKDLVEFQNKVARLYNAITAASSIIKDVQKQLKLIENSLKTTVGVKKEPLIKLREIERNVKELSIALTGNPSISSRNENQTPSVYERINYILWGIWSTSSEPTQTQKDAYRIASMQLVPILDSIREISHKDIKELMNQLEELKSPWIPGVMPNWKPE